MVLVTVLSAYSPRNAKRTNVRFVNDGEVAAFKWSTWKVTESSPLQVPSSSSLLKLVPTLGELSLVMPNIALHCIALYYIA